MNNPTLKQWLFIFILSQGVYIFLVIGRTTKYSKTKQYETKYVTSSPFFRKPKYEVHRLKLSIFGDKFQYFTYTKIPILLNGRNDAIINAKENCTVEKLPANNSAYIYAVTNYHPDELLKHKLAIYGRIPPTVDEIEARNAEILQTLQSNLNHALILKIYVFVEHYESAVFLNSVDFENSQKLVIQWTNGTILLVNTMMYISKCLQNKIVLKIHQDNRIGRGFEKINRDVLIYSKLMYALTRQPSKELCYHSWGQANCAVGKYVGSHDAFMFHVKDDYTDEDLDYLKSTKAEAHELGMENIFLWVFMHILKYEILNPCKILHVHHEHCVPIRKKKLRRINNQVSSVVQYSYRLS